MKALARPGPVRTYFLLTLYGAIATAVGVFLGWLVLQQIDIGEIGGMLRRINLLVLVLAFATVLFAAYLRGLRWRILLHDEDISAKRLFFVEQAGTALDTLSVVHLLDEVVEVGILTVRDKLPIAKVLATLAMQRTLEFGTIALMLTGGALFLSPMRPYTGYLITGLLLSVAALTALFIIGPALRRMWLISHFKLVHEFGDAVALLRARPGQSLQAFGLSVAQSALIGFAGWMLAFSLGMRLDPLTMIVITLAVMFFGSFVPGLPMAFGTFEFAAVSLLRLWEVSASDAVGFVLALRGVLYLTPIMVAVVFLPSEGLFSVPAVRRLLAEANTYNRHRNHVPSH